MPLVPRCLGTFESAPRTKGPPADPAANPGRTWRATSESSAWADERFKHFKLRLFLPRPGPDLGSIHRAFLIPHSKSKKLRNAAFLTQALFSPFCIPLAQPARAAWPLRALKCQMSVQEHAVEASRASFSVDSFSINTDFKLHHHNEPEGCVPSKKNYIEQLFHYQQIQRGKKFFVQCDMCILLSFIF